MDRVIDLLAVRPGWVSGERSGLMARMAALPRLDRAAVPVEPLRSDPVQPVRWLTAPMLSLLANEKGVA